MSINQVAFNSNFHYGVLLNLGKYSRFKMTKT